MSMRHCAGSVIRWHFSLRISTPDNFIKAFYFTDYMADYIWIKSDTDDRDQITTLLEFWSDTN